MDEYAYLFGCGHWEPVATLADGEPALVSGMTTACRRCRNLRRVEHVVMLPPAVPVPPDAKRRSISPVGLRQSGGGGRGQWRGSREALGASAR
jgi:hypothetical protein